MSAKSGIDEKHPNKKPQMGPHSAWTQDGKTKINQICKSSRFSTNKYWRVWVKKGKESELLIYKFSVAGITDTRWEELHNWNIKNQWL